MPNTKLIVVAVAVATIGFLSIDQYVPRPGLFWNLLNANVTVCTRPLYVDLPSWLSREDDPPLDFSEFGTPIPPPPPGFVPLEEPGVTVVERGPAPTTIKIPCNLRLGYRWVLGLAIALIAAAFLLPNRRNH